MKTLRKKVKGETPISHLPKIKTFNGRMVEGESAVVVVLACWVRETWRKENVKKI